MFYFCPPHTLPKARGCQNFPASVHVLLVANESLSRKSICWKNTQQLLKEAGWSEPEPRLYHGGGSHHCAVGTLVRMCLLVPARPGWMSVSMSLGRLLCPCPVVSLAADSEPRVGASDGGSLGDACTHWVPVGEVMGGRPGFLSASVTGGLPSHQRSPVDAEMLA